MSVQVADVLAFLVGRSAAPSSFGAQLSRLRDGLTQTPDPFRARDDIENQLLTTAVVLRCMDDFYAKREFPGPYKILTKLQDNGNSDRPQGAIALGILRAFQERSKGSEETGLVAVYNYLSVIAPEAVPPAPKNTELLQAFREGTAKRARHFAAEAYADSLLALGQHVKVFNRREARK